MTDRWFVVEARVTMDSAMEVKMAAGPFSTSESAAAAARGFKQPGEYIIYGPAPATRKVTIATPVVSDEAL